MNGKFFLIEVGPNFKPAYESLILRCPIFNESNVFLLNVVTDHFKIIPITEEDFKKASKL